MGKNHWWLCYEEIFKWDVLFSSTPNFLLTPNHLNPNQHARIETSSLQLQKRGFLKVQYTEEVFTHIISCIFPFLERTKFT